MLALLPPGELDGMLFKAHFLNRLPADIRNHVVAAGFNSTSREMAAMADNLWFASNSRQGGNKSSQAVTAVKEDYKHLVGAVAVISLQPKQPQPKKKADKAHPAATTAAAAPLGNPSCLLYLVDSGSTFSIIPHKSSPPTACHSSAGAAAHAPCTPAPRNSPGASCWHRWPSPSLELIFSATSSSWWMSATRGW